MQFFFFNFWSKTRDPDWIRIGIQPKMLDGSGLIETGSSNSKDHGSATQKEPGGHVDTYGIRLLPEAERRGGTLASSCANRGETYPSLQRGSERTHRGHPRREEHRSSLQYVIIIWCPSRHSFNLFFLLLSFTVPVFYKIHPH
jgi:hypothetical protein